MSYFNSVEYMLEFAAMHRSFADLAKCDEARLDHEKWATWYENRVAFVQSRRPNYSVITQDVANLTS